MTFETTVLRTGSGRNLLFPFFSELLAEVLPFFRPGGETIHLSLCLKEPAPHDEVDKYVVSRFVHVYRGTFTPLTHIELLVRRSTVLLIILQPTCRS